MFRKLFNPSRPSSTRGTSESSGSRGINPHFEPPHPAQSTVTHILAQSKIVVFGKSGCLSCWKAKKLLDSNHVAYAVVNVDLREDDGEAIMHYLERITGQRTVPNVFVRGEHVGGNDTLHDMDRAGTLQVFLNRQ
ncbi:thioredoxin-like protein [Chytriomyces sp. MP71]|nr:thioredoxin-like protein [Chytriomyces sp. MP71]